MSNKNIDTSIVLQVLKKIPLFSGLDQTLHDAIIQHIVLMYYPANYSLFKEGDEGDALYIIKKGQVEIFHAAKEEGEEPKIVAEIGEGGFLGEMALISDAPRNASAKTVTESEVFILSRDDFKQLLESNPTLAEQISAAVVSRTNENLQ